MARALKRFPVGSKNPRGFCDQITAWEPFAAFRHVRFGSLADMLGGMKRRPLYPR
jgi:hypothetical protein